jgi:hypothetical protein
MFFPRTLLLTLLLVTFGAALLPRPAAAQNSVTMLSAAPLVQPLQPVEITLTVPGANGNGSLLIFDSRARLVGTYPLTFQNGNGRVTVEPAGAAGAHWAALFDPSGSMVLGAPLYTLDPQTTLRSGAARYDLLPETVRSFLAADRVAYQLDGLPVAGYRSPDSPLLWLRDHYYQNRGFRYWEPDLTSLPAAFVRAQAADGSLPDFLARPELGIDAFRTPVEADVEYLFVQLVYETWQTGGDREWMLQMLPAAQRAVNYTLTDGQRWDAQLGLVKRPLTIDTWDYEYGPTTVDAQGRPSPRHWIDGQTRWGIFHGDNSGLAAALRMLATMEEQAGQWESAWYRRQLADDIMTRLNALSWNGRFYTHHVKLVPEVLPGVNEAEQLSLSNAIALNRGVLTLEQGRAILAEYQRRLNDPTRTAFAEWYAIDPAYPAGAFGMAGRLGERPGEYVNGGIMPLVGGELARGAFRYGEEAYGFDILARYSELLQRSGASYLWYYPTGGIAPAEHFLPTDGWGASAMLAGLIEGAAGIEDSGINFSTATLSPRWPAAPRDTITDVYAVARYAAGNGYLAYRWQHQLPTTAAEGRLQLTVTGSGDQVLTRILLPAGAAAQQLLVDGALRPLQIETVAASRYVVVPIGTLRTTIEIRYRQAAAAALVMP